MYATDLSLRPCTILYQLYLISQLVKSVFYEKLRILLPTMIRQPQARSLYSNRILSAIRAINSELVGLPLPELTV